MNPSLKQAMAGLTVKQERIETELEIFRRELREDLEVLPKSLVQLVEYMQDHLFDPELNVNNIKRQFHLRDHNFGVPFRYALGVTPRHYIEILRMGAADRLLRTGDVEIYLVAMSVGYCHQETFFRAFQRHFGCPPSHRRNEGGNKGRENVKVDTQEKPPRQTDKRRPQTDFRTSLAQWRK
ncbi:MAG: AraC family transcriptional regulator [Thermoanaerobaculia bacterium]